MITGNEFVGAYHELWHVGQSVPTSKTDLRARPIFHHTRDAIEAHLTIVLAAGLSIRKILCTLRPLHEVQISIGGQTITARPDIPDEVPRSIRSGALSQFTTPVAAPPSREISR